MPLCTLQLLSTAVSQRHYLRDRYQRQLLTWQTRTIAQCIAATIRVQEAGDLNPLMDFAMLVCLDKEDQMPTDIEAPVVSYSPPVVEKLIPGTPSGSAPEIPDGPESWSPGDPMPEAPANAPKYESLIRAFSAGPPR